jgi:AICAR transformylase/IMP cyclohydrolase PurH
MKQTAVDWLIKEVELISNSKGMSRDEIIELYNRAIQQAKEMEKDQIKKAYLDSSRETCLTYGENPPHDDPKFAELYYKKTYEENEKGN